MIEAPLARNEAQRLAFIHDRLRVINSPLEERFERITRMVCLALQVPISAVSIVLEDQQWFKSIQGLKTVGTPRSQAFCAHAILGDETLVVPDATQDPRFHDNPLVTGDPGIRFYAGHPLKMGPDLRVGTLCAIDRVPREFDRSQRQVLTDLAKMVESELLSQELSESYKELLAEVADTQRAALLDPVARIWNRAGVERLLAKEWAVAGRSGQTLALLFVDLDDFKLINDRHGHLRGDDALRQVAKFLLRGLRASDIVGRWGGDEFVAVLSGLDEANLQPIMEKLRADSEMLCLDEDPAIPLRLSIGGACGYAAGGSCQDLIARADQAMYQAKAAKKLARGHA